MPISTVSPKCVKRTPADMGECLYFTTVKGCSVNTSVQRLLLRHKSNGLFTATKCLTTIFIWQLSVIYKRLLYMQESSYKMRYSNSRTAPFLHARTRSTWTMEQHMHLCFQRAILILAKAAQMQIITELMGIEHLLLEQ